MSACCLVATAALLVMGGELARERPSAQPVAQNPVSMHPAPARPDHLHPAGAYGAGAAHPNCISLPESFFTGRLSGGVGYGPAPGSHTRTRIWVMRRAPAGGAGGPDGRGPHRRN